MKEREFCTNPPGCVLETLKGAIEEIRYELNCQRETIMELVRLTAELSLIKNNAKEHVTRKEIYFIVMIVSLVVSSVFAMVNIILRIPK